MKKWLHHIEIIVDKLIPFLLLILLFIVIGEFGFHDFIFKYRLVVSIIDGFIIFIFVLDLVFKYLRIRNFPKFLKASWLEIIAVFPFFLVFRFFEGLFGLFGVGETVARTQQIVHVVEGTEREITAVVKEGTRAERLTRFLRPLARSVRFFKLSNPEVMRRTRKELKRVGKEAEIIVKEVEEVPRHVKAALFYEKPGIDHSQITKRSKK